MLKTVSLPTWSAEGKVARSSTKFEKSLRFIKWYQCARRRLRFRVPLSKFIKPFATDHMHWELTHTCLSERLVSRRGAKSKGRRAKSQGPRAKRLQSSSPGAHSASLHSSSFSGHRLTGGTLEILRNLAVHLFDLGEKTTSHQLKLRRRGCHSK